MAQSSDSSGPTQPLNVGNVVTAGFRLYGAKLKQYLLISLIATAWILLAVSVAIAIAVFFVVVKDYYAFLALLIPAWLVLFVYCYVRSLTNTALISRLAFGELASQPESLKDARRFVNSRQWSFLLTQILVSLIFTGVFTVIYIAWGILLFIVLMAMGLGMYSGGFQSGGSPSGVMTGAFVVVILLLYVLLLGLLIGVLGWFYARLGAAEVPLAVEPQTTAVETISRIWSLTQGHGWRIFLVLCVTVCATLPFQAIPQIIGISAGFTAPTTSDDIARFFALQGISVLLSLVLGVFILPLWQSIKAVFYFDLRNRREGLDLQLRDREPKV